MRMLILAFFLVFSSISLAIANDASLNAPIRGMIPFEKKTIKDASPEQIDQALSVTFECQQSSFSRTYYDCDCLGIRFLEFQLNHGRDASDYIALVEAQKRCPNSADVAGTTYMQCETWAPNSRPYDYQEFCSCYASEYAKLYSRNTSQNEYVREQQMTSALMTCDGGKKLNERLHRQAILERLKNSGLYKFLFPDSQ